MKRYPAYKDSGVEWIGEIPSEWKTIKLKHLTNKIGSGITPRGGAEVYSDSGIPLLRSQNVHFDGFKLGEVAFISQEIHDSMGGTKVKPNDVLLNITGASIGRCCYVPDNFGAANVNQHVCILRPNRKIESQILNYLLASIVGQAQVFHNQVGTSREGLNFEQLKNFIFCLADKSEREIIVKYLDHKTRLIDTLIEKKQKQIELLQEQRAAIINQAVTKGLDPNVKMKDSGIEWLGEVPEHWDVKKLKHIAKIKYGLGQPPKELEGGLPLIRATNVNRGQISENGLIYVDPQDVPYDRDPVLRENDIIVVRSGAYTADSAIIPEKYDGAIAGYDMVVRVQAALPKLISYVLLSNYVLNNQLFLKRMRAAQPHLNAEELGETMVLLPPDLSEQKEVLGHIETKSKIIESTISKERGKIELLTEYRTTLISEVVTGKIDVRDEVVP